MEITKSKLNELAEEVKSCITEGVFTSRWALVEMAHKIGELISEFEEAEKIPMSQFLPRLAERVGRSERTLYRAAQIYHKWPDKDLIPLGKTATVNKLMQIIAPNENQEERCKHCFHCPKEPT